MAELPARMCENDLDNVFRRVASELKRKEWRHLACILGLKDYHVEDITKLHPGSFSKQKYEMLLLWKHIYDKGATVERLIDALDKMAEDIKNGYLATDEEKVEKMRQQRMKLASSIRPRRTLKDPRDPLSNAVNIRGTAVHMQMRGGPVFSVSPRAKTSRIRPIRRKINRWHRAMTGRPMRTEVHRRCTTSADTVLWWNRGSLAITVDVVDAIPAKPIKYEITTRDVEILEDMETPSLIEDSVTEPTIEDPHLHDNTPREDHVTEEPKRPNSELESGLCSEEIRTESPADDNVSVKSDRKRKMKKDMRDAECQTDFPYEDDEEDEVDAQFTNLEDGRSTPTSLAKSMSIRFSEESTHVSRPPSSILSGAVATNNTTSTDPFSRLLANITEPYFTHLIHDMVDIDKAIDQLERIKGVFIEDVKRKCLLFDTALKDMQSLEILWSEYQDGRLNAMFQKELVNERTLKVAQALGITLKTTISEDDYAMCVKSLTTPLGSPNKKLKALPKTVTRFRGLGADAKKKKRQRVFPTKRRDDDDTDEITATPKVPNPTPEMMVSQQLGNHGDGGDEEENRDGLKRLKPLERKRKTKATVEDVKEMGRKLSQMMSEGATDTEEPLATTMELEQARLFIKKALEDATNAYSYFELEIQRFIQALKSVKPVKVSKILSIAEVEMYAKKAVERSREPKTPPPAFTRKSAKGKNTNVVERRISVSEERLLNVQFLEEYLNTINELRIIRSQFDIKIWQRLAKFDKTEGPNQMKMKTDMAKILARWDKLLSDNNDFSDLSHPESTRELKPYQIRCYAGVVSLVHQVINVAKSIDEPLGAYLQYS